MKVKKQVTATKMQIEVKTEVYIQVKRKETQIMQVMNKTPFILSRINRISVTEKHILVFFDCREQTVKKIVKHLKTVM